MAKRRCSRCKKYLRKGTKGKLCKRCKGKLTILKRKKGLSDQAIVNLQYCHHYLAEHPCIDCGETDIVVLQFDHVRGHKRDNVSSLARSGHPLEVIKTEIDKCEIRCANCHVRKTAREQNWYKAKES